MKNSWVYSLALSAISRDGLDELARHKMANPQVVTDAYVKALDEDEYGKAMKHYLQTKEWPMDQPFKPLYKRI